MAIGLTYSLRAHVVHSLNRRTCQAFTIQQRRRPCLVASDPDDVSSLLGDIGLPDIDQDLEGYQEEAGAVFIDGQSVPVSYGNNSKAIYSVEEDGVFIDVSDCPRIRVAGPDAAAFLHGQTSVDVEGMLPGSSKEACILTAQGRIIDLVLLVRTESGFLVICSQDMGQQIADHFRKHIFMSDDVEVLDVSGATAMFRVMGPKSNDILYTLELSQTVLGGEFGTHEVVGFDGEPLIVIKGTDLGYSGYTLIISESGAAALWNTLSAFEIEPMGTEAWNIARILSGRPKAPSELNDSYTPFDCGLYHTVCLNKGCYVGQEALAKIYNLDAGKWEMWGLSAEKPCAEGDEIFVVTSEGNVKAGKVSSYVDTIAGEHRALCFLDRKLLCKEHMPSAWNATAVNVGADMIQAHVKSLPYPTRALNDCDRPRSVDPKVTQDTENDAKLKQMQERLDAWRSSQGSPEN